jgi:hypothetical protein
VTLHHAINEDDHAETGPPSPPALWMQGSGWRRKYTQRSGAFGWARLNIVSQLYSFISKSSGSGGEPHENVA